MLTFLLRVDDVIITACKAMAMPIARVALFIIYFWFGILKVVGASPANPLVATLLETTMPFLSFDSFIIGFGIFEVLIGILFLIPKLDRLAIVLFAAHMVMTGMILVLLPAVAWDGAFVPTLEGQYVIKNIALLGLVIVIISRMKPMHRADNQ